MSVRPPELPIPGWALQLGARPGAHVPMPEARLLALIAGSSGQRDVQRNVGFWRARGRDGLVGLSEGTQLVVGHATALQALRHPDAGNSRELVDQAPPQGAYDRLGRSSIAYVDGPDHRRLRKVIGPLLDRPAAEARTDAIRATIGAQLARLGPRVPNRIEVINTVIRPVIASLVGDLCGIEAADRQRVAEWLAAGELRWRRTPFVGPAIRRRSDSGLEAFGDWLRRAASSGALEDGVFSSLMADGGADDDAAIGSAFFAYGAARVTVERFLGSALNTLGDATLVSTSEPPEVTQRLIDELLRWDPPAAVAARVTRIDLTFGDTTVPAGTQLVALMRVVNRDPDVFDAPDTVVVDRDPNPHLAFSAGAHYCLGAPLARVEGAVILEELLGWLWPYRVVEGPREGVGLPHRPITSLVLGSIR